VRYTCIVDSPSEAHWFLRRAEYHLESGEYTASDRDAVALIEAQRRALQSADHHRLRVVSPELVHPALGNVAVAAIG
jgi:hypothetical protein